MANQIHALKNVYHIEPNDPIKRMIDRFGDYFEAPPNQKLAAILQGRLEQVLKESNPDDQKYWRSIALYCEHGLAPRSNGTWERYGRWTQGNWRFTQSELHGLRTQFKQ